MSFTHTVLLIAAGFGAGAMNAIAGGGTILTFPALMLVGGNALRANTTSTVALIIGTVGSMVAYRRHVPRVAHWLKLFTPVSIIGGFLGGLLLTFTPSKLFEAMVPFLLLFATALFMLHSFFRRHAQHAAQEHVHPTKLWLAGATLFQFGVSVYGGYFGAGIGILMLAALGLLGFTDIHRMNALKNLLAICINGVAAAIFIASGAVIWSDVLVMMFAAVAGGYTGARLAYRLGRRFVRVFVIIVGLVMSVSLFFR
jgi:uncharacterized protein